MEAKHEDKDPIDQGKQDCSVQSDYSIHTPLISECSLLSVIGLQGQGDILMESSPTSQFSLPRISIVTASVQSAKL